MRTLRGRTGIPTACATLFVVLSGACDRKQEVQKTVAQPKPPQTGVDRISELVKPWHPFREEWVDRAALIVKAGYRPGTYPCIFHENSIDMIASHTFEAQEVLKGEIGRPDFDVDMSFRVNPDGTRVRSEDEFPHDLLRGRTYLVFLKPSAESQAILADAKKFFNAYTAIGEDETVAIVDISKSEKEAEAEKVAATSSGTYKGFTFTPEAWASLRASKEVDVNQQSRFMEFIEHVVLPGGADVVEVRSYLGAPDYHYTNDDGIFYRYYLSADLCRNPREGVPITTLEFSFNHDLRLADYDVEHHRYDAAEKCLREISDEEIEQLWLWTALGWMK